MKQFVDAGRAAVRSQNWMAALMMAVTLPDICGNIDSPGSPVGGRYKAWAATWLADDFAVLCQQAVTPEDIYRLRCQVLHCASADDDGMVPAGDRAFVFTSGGGHLNVFYNTQLAGTVIPYFVHLDAANFSETIFQAVERWEADARKDANKALELDRLFTIDREVILRGSLTLG